MFVKPIEVDVKESESGVFHNLPSKDYKSFIGRKKELERLEEMFLHRRHFINALDGIGGVGKTAIALEFCEKIINSDPDANLFFEHVVWLSAKDSKLKDGKIHKLDQAFEHLDQLLDTVLEVLHFGEYKKHELQVKKNMVIDLLSITNALIVLDNLETLKKGNLKDIWDFINEIPDPSKVLLTSREFHYDVPQTLRIGNLSETDSHNFIKQYSKELGLETNKIQPYTSQIVHFSSGLPIAIKSILGQVHLGKSFKKIQKGLENNTDNLAKFCFQQQLSLLEKEHMKVMLFVCLSSELLDYEAIIYMAPELNSKLIEVVNELSSLSILKITNVQDTDYYSILPIIKAYILSTYDNEEVISQVKKQLNNYYQLKETDTYALLPVEERSIDRGSLIPRKLVDKAMKHSDAEEFEEAEQVFKMAIKDYDNESYVWYMYGMYLAKYNGQFSEAINCLRKADDLTPNYLYNKKIGDYHTRMKNYQAAVKNYKNAMEKSSLEQNKNEMKYCIAKTEFQKVKQIRRSLKKKKTAEKFKERNETYKNIIYFLEEYVKGQPGIYDGKLIYIYRMLSESYFGVRDCKNALEYINETISLSEGEETHVEYKKIILDFCN